MNDFFRQFSRQRSSYIVAFFLLAIVLVAVLGEAIAPYDPNEVQIKEKLQAPGPEHWLGTDNLGRDLFSRILVATRLSLLAALMILVLSVVTGTALGLASGYLGGAIDELLMRLTDIFLAFPPLVLALTITAVLGPSLRNAMLAISIAWWPWYARLVRGLVLSVREKDYVLAARSCGTQGWRIMFQHMLPNLVTPVIVQAAMDMGGALILASSLSFLGMGAQPPQAEWGAMISEGRRYVYVAWWLGAFPGLAIFGTVYLFNALGSIVNRALAHY